MNKEVFKDISYGMYIVSTKGNVGCVINTLIQLTSDNPKIAISLNKNNYTNEIIKKNKKFVVAILNIKTDPNVISKFGFTSSKDNDKFKDLNYDLVSDIPVLNGESSGYLVCEVIDIVDVGSHDLFIAEVIKSEKTNNLKPMTYSYYQEVIKGRSPKNAPTYIEEETDDYVCDICGYVHKGPLSDDYVCPICGAKASHFKKRNL